MWTNFTEFFESFRPEIKDKINANNLKLAMGQTWEAGKIQGRLEAQLELQAVVSHTIATHKFNKL